MYLSRCRIDEFLNDELRCRFMSQYTGLSLDRVEEECDRENFLKPQQAIELGIIDGIVE